MSKLAIAFGFFYPKRNIELDKASLTEDMLETLQRTTIIFGGCRMKFDGEHDGIVRFVPERENDGFLFGFTYPEINFVDIEKSHESFLSLLLKNECENCSTIMTDSTWNGKKGPFCSKEMEADVDKNQIAVLEHLFDGFDGINVQSWSFRISWAEKLVHLFNDTPLAIYFTE